MATTYLYPTSLIFDANTWNHKTAIDFLLAVGSDDGTLAEGHSDVLFEFNASSLTGVNGEHTINSLVGEFKWCKSYDVYGYAYASWQKDGIDMYVDTDPVNGALSSLRYAEPPYNPSVTFGAPRLWTSPAFPGTWTRNSITGHIQARIGNQVYLAIEYVRIKVDYTAASAPVLLPNLSTSSTSSSAAGGDTQAGSVITYTTKVRNTGAAPATNVVLAATAPSNASSRTWTVTGGSPTATSGSNNIVSTLLSLAAGAEATIVYTLTATAAGSVVFPTITADCDELAVQNIVGVTDVIIAGASTPGAGTLVTVASTITGSGVNPSGSAVNGGIITSDWTLVNAGPADMVAASISLPLPTGSTRTWSVVSPSTGSFSGGTSGTGAIVGSVTLLAGQMIKFHSLDDLPLTTSSYSYNLAATCVIPSGQTNASAFVNPKSLSVAVDAPPVDNPPPPSANAGLAIASEPIIGTAGPGERLTFVWRIKNASSGVMTRPINLPQPVATSQMKWELLGTVGTNSTAVVDPSYGIGPIADLLTLQPGGYAYYRVSVKTSPTATVGTIVTFLMNIGGGVYSATGEVLIDQFRESREEVAWKQTMDGFMGLSDSLGGLPGNQRMQDHFNKGIRLHHIVQDLVDRRGYPTVISPSGRTTYPDDLSEITTEVTAPAPPASGGISSPRGPAPSAPGVGSDSNTSNATPVTFTP